MNKAIKFTRLPDVTQGDHIKGCKEDYCIMCGDWAKWGGQPKANFPLHDDRSGGGR